jgi:hypothetical protein
MTTGPKQKRDQVVETERKREDELDCKRHTKI